MSMQLSFCDISVRYGQTSAPRQSLAEKTGWDPNKLFLSYLLKVRERRNQDDKEAEEDALMDMIDAMNASEEDKKMGKTNLAEASSLADAGKAIIAQHETVLEDGAKLVTWFDPTQTLTVQVLMACLGDRFTFEQADKVQENQEKAEENQEQQAEKEKLEVTEKRTLSETGDPTTLKGGEIQ